ncbi:hypothetical protein ACFXGI_17050 [Streptomyces sp. NPDC059355]|uniref:hypothetical protein n=1 Tax=Streptomyces sp. NPDC059355 TaxID=3346811 RepID=UPI00367E8952
MGMGERWTRCDGLRGRRRGRHPVGAVVEADGPVRLPPGRRHRGQVRHETAPDRIVPHGHHGHGHGPGEAGPVPGEQRIEIHGHDVAAPDRPPRWFRPVAEHRVRP